MSRPPFPADAPRWYDGAGIVAFVTAAALILELLVAGCTAADWRAVNDALDALAPPEKPGRPPGTMLDPGRGAWVRLNDNSTVRLDWSTYCDRYKDVECNP